MTECEAVLLGREPIHGSANAAALATLVKSLSRKTDHRRKYILRCSRDKGLQMTPCRQEDEGFESDEDITSISSCDDNHSSMYVSDHALHVKSLQPRSSSQLSSSTDATVGSVSSAGTDSANSSASDNDDTDNSITQSVTKSKEEFAFHEVAFCHTDSSMPRIIVWVVKTRTQSKTNNEYSYGLEAIVFQCQNEEKHRTLLRHFQEYSRRQKLEKTVRHPTRWKDELHLKSKPTNLPTEKPKPASKSENTSSFNLIQRVDTDGITHIEITRSLVPNGKPYLLSDSHEPSSIISINTPDLGDVKTVSKSDNSIDGIIRVDVDDRSQPPERPERKKHRAPAPPATREKVVRGQYVRVAVDQRTMSSPTSRGWLFSEAKPCGDTLHPWESRRSRPTTAHQRSKSTTRESPKRYPMAHRYVDPQINSLPNRFFGKLKELTGNGNKFRRRNSIGDLTNPNCYQDGKRLDKCDLAKSTPNLKSVIKNKNGKYYKDGYGEQIEPKKVTFSAYATVQMVD